MASVYCRSRKVRDRGIQERGARGEERGARRTELLQKSHASPHGHVWPFASEECQNAKLIFFSNVCKRKK